MSKAVELELKDYHYGNSSLEHLKLTVMEYIKCAKPLQNTYHVIS